MAIPPDQTPQRTRFRDVRHLTTTGSTNADVLALGRNGEPEGIVVIADSQTTGRGRHDRTWVAEPGSAMLASILLRPPAAAAPLVTATLALAAADAIDATTDIRVDLKWPNDLMVGGRDGAHDRKIAGILAEADWPTGTSISGGYRTPAAAAKVLVAAGIGINVRTQHDAPPEVADHAIALDALVEQPPSVADLAEAFLDALDRSYDALLADPRTLLDRWRDRCDTIGRAVRVDLGTDDVEGTAVDIDDEGRLVVQTLGGTRRAFAAGDVVHLRRDA